MKQLVHHPAQGLNPSKHIIQEVHDVPWIGVWGSNTGPELTTAGGALMCQCCCGSRNFVVILANVHFLV